MITISLEMSKYLSELLLSNASLEGRNQTDKEIKLSSRR